MAWLAKNVGKRVTCIVRGYYRSPFLSPGQGVEISDAIHKRLKEDKTYSKPNCGIEFTRLSDDAKPETAIASEEPNKAAPQATKSTSQTVQRKAPGRPPAKKK